MINKHQKPLQQTPEELLKNNPKVSKSVVERYAQLKKQLKKLGVDIPKPRYTLSHPFERQRLNKKQRSVKSRYTLSPPFGEIGSNLHRK